MMVAFKASRLLWISVEERSRVCHSSSSILKLRVQHLPNSTAIALMAKSEQPL